MWNFASISTVKRSSHNILKRNVTKIEALKRTSKVTVEFFSSAQSLKPSQWGFIHLTEKVNHLPFWSNITLSSNSKNTARTNTRWNFYFDIFLNTNASFSSTFSTIFRNDFTISTTSWTYRNLTIKERKECKSY